MLKSSTAFLVTGVMSATHVTLDHIKPHSNLFEAVMEAHLYESRVGAESSSTSQKNIVIDVDDAVIFALRYQAFRFKRSSKKLELVDFDTRYNDIGGNAEPRQVKLSSIGKVAAQMLFDSAFPAILYRSQKRQSKRLQEVDVWALEDKGDSGTPS